MGTGSYYDRRHSEKCYIATNIIYVMTTTAGVL